MIVEDVYTLILLPIMKILMSLKSYHPQTNAILELTDYLKEKNLKEKIKLRKSSA